MPDAKPPKQAAACRKSWQRRYPQLTAHKTRRVWRRSGCHDGGLRFEVSTPPFGPLLARQLAPPTRRPQACLGLASVAAFRPGTLPAMRHVNADGDRDHNCTLGARAAGVAALHVKASQKARSTTTCAMDGAAGGVLSAAG